MGHDETGRILIVDDQAAICYAMQRFLVAEGFEVETAGGGEEALSILSHRSVNVVVMDVTMPGMDGLKALARIKELHPATQVILMTAFSSTERAIEAMKQGAFDFLLKPFDNAHLLKVVTDALQSGQMLADLVFDRQVQEDGPEERIVGNSRKMLEIFKQIGKAAPTEATVLIQGETGTGKELVARAIYQHSRRTRKPFLAINCSAIPDALLESELFGHEKGAFTGAAVRHPGKFEQCNGGTIFLDEIGDLPLPLQGKLLRVLQDGSFQRVGGTETLRVDVRLIAATHRDLTDMVRKQNFREDLFYRINVLTIILPPLRERREDIEELCIYSIRKYNRLFNKNIRSIASDTLERLKCHTWPGNVRELENVIQKAVLLASDNSQELTLPASGVQGCSFHSPLSCQNVVEGFVERLFADGMPCSLPDLIQQMETRMVARALALTAQNQVQAARLLGIARNTLRKKLMDTSSY